MNEAAKDNFRSAVYEGVGHAYTPQMWAETKRWLVEHLEPQAVSGEGGK